MYQEKGSTSLPLAHFLHATRGQDHETASELRQAGGDTVRLGLRTDAAAHVIELALTPTGSRVAQATVTLQTIACVWSYSGDRPTLVDELKTRLVRNVSFQRQDRHSGPYRGGNATNDSAIVTLPAPKLAPWPTSDSDNDNGLRWELQVALIGNQGDLLESLCGRLQRDRSTTPG